MAVFDVEDVEVEVGEEPLVRVDAEAVGVLEPGCEVAEFGADERCACPCGVGVEPEVVAACDGRELVEWVECSGCGCSECCAEEGWVEAGVDVLGDGVFERGGVEAELVVGFDCADECSVFCVVGEAGDHGCFDDGGMGLCGGIDGWSEVVR